MVELSFFAVFVLVVACVAAGVTAAVVHTWSLRALTYSLETRLAVVEGTLSREVKARAGQERWKQPAKAEADLAARLAIAAQGSAPARPVPWWKNPALKQGGYP
jgi:hypothetical protein